jgi:hypothetical protein
MADLPYKAAKTATQTEERLGGYKVTPEEMNYDSTAALPGAESRADATVQAVSAANHDDVHATQLAALEKARGN